MIWFDIKNINGVNDFNCLCCKICEGGDELWMICLRRLVLVKLGVN